MNSLRKQFNMMNSKSFLRMSYNSVCLVGLYRTQSSVFSISSSSLYTKASFLLLIFINFGILCILYETLETAIIEEQKKNTFSFQNQLIRVL